MTGFVVFAHGSRVESANAAVRSVAADLEERSGHPVEPAFLELGTPDLAGATGRLIGRGASRVIVIPYFLTLGTHMQRDLPRLARAASRANGNVDMLVTSPLDGHPGLLQALFDRAQESLASGEGRA